MRGEEPNLEEVQITSSGREEALEHWWTRETRMSSSNNRVVRTETALGAEAQLVARARQVLRQNDMGDWTRAAPNLYPHQWSWDSAFIAIGLEK